MQLMNNLSQHIHTLHTESILQWKHHGVSLVEEGFKALVEENHAFNYQLWHAEDRARREDKGFEYVYRAKREIDACNQSRNNKMEAMDEWLFRELKPECQTLCPVHSESPGMMIDRLSILALKAYHMGLQVTRPEVELSHQTHCLNKLEVILKQQQQLLECLASFLQEIQAKTRTFKVYHQFKMYNDPTLNPQLYAQ